MIDFEAVLRAFAAQQARIMIVGGLAATIHGSPRTTVDLDLLYSRDDDNLQRIAAAIAPFSPYPRDAPRGLPFLWDAQTIRQGLNFTLTTTLGDIDLFGELLGVGDFETARPHAIEAQVFGLTLLCLDLPTLIRSKRAANRAKDWESLAILEALNQKDSP